MKYLIALQEKVVREVVVVVEIPDTLNPYDEALLATVQAAHDMLLGQHRYVFKELDAVSQQVCDTVRCDDRAAELEVTTDGKTAFVGRPVNRQ